MTIPNSVTKIDWYTFGYCNNLTSVTIPKSVTKIGNYAFQNCNNLTIQCYASSEAHIYAKVNNIRVELLDAAAKPEITAQPGNAKVNAGEKAVFTVEAKRAGSYQWYFRKASGNAWQKVSGGTAATFSFTAQAAHNGQQLGCLVKNDNGSVYSKAVMLTVITKPVMTDQPKDAQVNEGKTAAFTVKAIGADSYQWYTRRSASGAWQKVSENGDRATLRFTAAAKQNGHQFRCLAKNSAGAVYSGNVTLTVHPLPVITGQPKDVTADECKKVSFKLTVTGADSYQWYYRKSTSGVWQKVSENGGLAALSFTAKAGQDGWQYRCLVKNGVGSVYSQTVELGAK